MQIAEKIFTERKRLGWSQEQLAEQMDVSRQAVSKWESGQSMPDLDKLVLMSQIFGVSTDYLLKDENTSSENPNTINENSPVNIEADSTHIPPQPNNSFQNIEPARTLTNEEVQQYKETCFKSAKKTALGVTLCIMGVILYMVMKLYITSSATSYGQPTIVLLICVAPAVALFISSGMKMESFQSLKKDTFLLPAASQKQLENEYETFSHKFMVRITTGVILCIIAVIAYQVSEGLVRYRQEYIQMGDISTIVLLSFIAIAVFLFVSTGIRKECYDVLLQQHNFTDLRKQNRKETNMNLITVVAGAYWCIVTAGFLAYSFITEDWGRSWIVWPIAGCLFGAISIILTFCAKKRK